MRYVIIGNSVAACGCIEAIRKVDTQNPIVVISDERYRVYSRPLISYYLAGKVDESKMYIRDEDYYEKHKVETLLGKRAISVDFKNKEVILDDESKIKYDRLLIATGGKPFVPPTKGFELKNVFTFIKFDDVKAIDEAIKGGAKKAVVIGAGLSGLKAAEALVKRGLEVTVVELANRILGSILDLEASKIVQAELEKHGIVFKLETSVDEIMGADRVERVRLKNGEVLDSDIVVFAIGVVPNIDFLKGTELKINRGIVVDDHMRTNIEDVYAAGDCAEGYDFVFEQQRVIPIWSNAYNQGETAGYNMAGVEKTFDRGFPMNSIGFFDVHMITAGIVMPNSDDIEVLVKHDREKNAYRKIYIKNGRVLGFMFINSIDRAGMITNMIKEGLNVESIKHRLLDEDFGYLDLPKELRQEKISGGAKA
ncbi:NAD(P)/FAD-dependent oxidoreductase [Caldicellulosiruptor morganii]|uniref:FAD-dependent oxidoreductase n=1 Tax=Caldicellulosiruptor morganii TaxID=1387555 RepID=A0ABY7BMS5_9FIRM|nr:FAD-dependent oxidoreductase [Caldicellulosiruptor morganii]WAM34158.1 FAD-dependent oxidoreductase [Caldicellulosiruptor morganii]